MSHLSAALAGSVLALAIVSEGHAFIHAINMNSDSYRIMDQSGGVIGYAGHETYQGESERRVAHGLCS
jgi:hypothetical protein